MEEILKVLMENPESVGVIVKHTLQNTKNPCMIF